MKNISKSYGRVHALENVHLTVNEREIVGLLGDNGLIRVVAADIDPKATTVRLLLEWLNPRCWRWTPRRPQLARPRLGLRSSVHCRFRR